MHCGHQLISEGAVKQKTKKFQNNTKDLSPEIWEKPRISELLWKTVGKEIKKAFGMEIEKAPEISYYVNPKSGYQVLGKDLKEIHKAAIIGDKVKMEKVLLQQIPTLNDRDKNNRTALHFACVNGHHEVVIQLMDAKCKLNLCDNENRTALIKAIQCQQIECAFILLEHLADPKVTDCYGNTALHYAACWENLSIATKLLSQGVDIEARNKNGFTPLLLAVSKNNQQMLEFLTSKGANVRAVDALKRTALMLALHCVAPKMIIFLLQQGIDVLCRDIFGRSAKDHAINYGLNMNCQQITEYLSENESGKSQVRNQGVNDNSRESSLCSNHQITSEDTVERAKPNFCPNMIYGLYYGAYDTEEYYLSSNQQLLPEDIAGQRTKSSENNTQDFGSAAVNNETCSRPRKIIVGDRSQSVPQNLSAGRRMVHSYFSEDPESCHKLLPDVEEIETIPYRAAWKYLQACKPAFPEKYPDMKPTTEVKDSVPNKGDAQAYVSGSPEKDPNLKSPMEVEDSVANKAVGIKDVQAPRSAFLFFIPLGA
ncbi:POTE ankyrin domain family member F-like isoform X2 [Erinaceus europaeus]|uniref:POTE ankyrin domain family member F-like isoform X2 n=1 Tax=Erinaceus europaeus TaxID=9365 RepID=A0ABM3XKE2_ERIEU|nr:POTE ankyrin domain family member F-like isoform X2 [Erinaceus europaeus]